MKKSKTNERGITLISLVITIILLLILATVAISLAVDSDGLFSKAGEAANSWNSSVAAEGTTLGELLGTLDKISSLPVTLSTELPQGWSSSVVSQVAKAGNRQAPIPEGFVVSGVDGENTIGGGLVIYEKTANITEVKSSNHERALTECNQYVWIPVDDINDMVMCQTCGDVGADLDKITLQCITCGTETKLAGKLYATELGNSFTANLTGQAYNANSGLREPAVVTGSDGTSYDGATNDYHDLADAKAFLEQMQADFENMAKSVNKYKGFYISRYEAGVGGSSKKGQTVITAATDEQMWYGLYNTLRKIGTNLTTHMIWGSQYDQAMHFIIEKERKDGTNAIFDIKRSASTRHNNAAPGPEVSGNNVADLVCNIYDLEGNYLEWTTEANDTEFRVARGRKVERWKFGIVA